MKIVTFCPALPCIHSALLSLYGLAENFLPLQWKKLAGNTLKHSQKVVRLVFALCDLGYCWKMKQFFNSKFYRRIALGGGWTLPTENSLEKSCPFLCSTHAVSFFNQVPASDSGSQMSGWLDTKGKRGWRRLWFVLKDQVLYSYKASHDVMAYRTLPVLGYTVDQPLVCFC